MLILHRPFGSGSNQSLTRVSCVVVLGIEGSFPNYHLCCAVNHRDIDNMENEHIMLEGPILHSKIKKKKNIRSLTVDLVLSTLNQSSCESQGLLIETFSSGVGCRLSI